MKIEIKTNVIELTILSDKLQNLLKEVEKTVSEINKFELKVNIGTKNAR